MTINEKRNLKKPVRIAVIVFLVLLLVGLFFGFRFYKTYFAPNVTGSDKYLYVKTGGNLEEVFQEIEKNKLLRDLRSFS